MRYAKIDFGDTINGEGVGITLFVQGCSNHCPDCFNKETWDFNGGYEFTEKELNQIINFTKKYDYISRLSVLGGEPLDNIELSLYIVKEFKRSFPNKKIWLWTGKRFSDITSNIKILELLTMVDVLIDGKFINELSNPNLLYKGSNNQRVIDVQQSLQQGKVILWKE